jgi:glucose-6-phosphate-specific signal transduction histidine kinase
MQLFDVTTAPEETLVAREKALRQFNQKCIARRLHDIISQKLTLLSLQTSLASGDIVPPANWAKNCKNWSDMSLEVGQVLRDIINDSKPKIADETSFLPNLRAFAYSISRDLTCVVNSSVQTITMDIDLANEFYAVCRDLIGSVFQSPGVGEIVVDLQQDENGLRVQVSASKYDRTPLVLRPEALNHFVIKERLSCLAGSAQLEQHPVLGTVVYMELPQAAQSISRAA